VGGGPKYAKPAGKVIYRLDHLIEWADAATFTSTSDETVRLNKPPTKRGRRRKDAAPERRGRPAEEFEL
jgi:hypothetical protein